MNKHYTIICLLALVIFSGCGRKLHDKPVEKMSFDELKKSAITALDEKQKRTAIMYLEHMVGQYCDDQNIASYKLLLADLYYQLRRYHESYELYSHFYELYPSDIKVEYAFYRTILSKYKQRSPYDCDSTVTEKTLGLCDEYLQNDRYIRYKKDIADLKGTCSKKLIDKEVYIFNNYLHRHQFKSAKNRLKYLREAYLPNYSYLEPQLLYLEGKLARYKKEYELVHEKVAMLVEKFPETRFARMARGLVKKDIFVL